ncbi:MAG: LOG family protein [Ignavibacteria bacterium]|nr:LOG family protein [Ignavibacteria bacterium]
MIKNKVITIFGSSFPKPGDEEYEFAYKLGKKLGENGFSICNGGFYGTMEATAKGASEVGAKTIGITVGSFDLIANKFIQEEIRCKTLFERIEKLISLADGFVVLKGGTGTLLEYSAILELINKNLLDAKPIAADKEFWTHLTNLMNDRNSYEGRKPINVFLSNDVDEIVSYFKKYFEEMK